jgi:aflatoxin B1 aldehyde reductase
MNEAHKAGKLERFRISNYSPEEVITLVEICERNGWVKPSMYQGQYNAIARGNEDELFPVLKTFLSMKK